MWRCCCAVQRPGPSHTTEPILLPALRGDDKRSREVVRPLLYMYGKTTLYPNVSNRGCERSCLSSRHFSNFTLEANAVWTHCVDLLIAYACFGAYTTMSTCSKSLLAVEAAVCIHPHTNTSSDAGLELGHGCQLQQRSSATHTLRWLCDLGASARARESPSAAPAAPAARTTVVHCHALFGSPRAQNVASKLSGKPV